MSYRIDDIARTLATPMPRRSAIAYLGGMLGGMFLAALPMRAQVIKSCKINNDCPKGKCCNAGTCIDATGTIKCGSGNTEMCCLSGTTCCAGGNVSMCLTSTECCGHQGANVTRGTPCYGKCCCGGPKCCFQHNKTCDTSGGCSTC